MKHKTSVCVGIIILITSIIISTIIITIYFKLSKPEFYKTFIDLGNKFLNESKYEEAILEFEKAIHIEPKSTEARVGNGKSYVGINKVDNAIEQFKEAQNLDIENINLLLEILEILKNIDSENAYQILQNYIDKTQNKIPNNIQQIINNSNNKPGSIITTPVPDKYINPINIKLNTDKLIVGYTFYYTLDGSEPSKESIKYSGDININKDTIIKIIAYNHKGESSEVITLEYFIDNKMMKQLEELIKECEVLIENTKEGTSIGNCVKGSKEKFRVTIDSVKNSLNKDNISFENANKMYENLNKELDEFKYNIIEKTDKVVLKDTILKAQNIYDKAVEGKKEGQYKVGSKSKLLNTIKEAQGIYDDILSKQNNIDKEVASLKTSIKNFEKSKNKNLSDLKNKYLSKIKDLEYRDEMLEELSIDMSNAEMGDYLWNISNEYDTLLINMNLELEKYLDTNSIEKLKQLKSKWIIEKKKAEDEFNKAISESPESWGNTGQYRYHIEAINKHCHEVINTLMN